MDKARLLADIQRECGIKLDETDPVLAAALINERMLDAALDDLRKAMKRATDRITEAGAEHEASAKRAASEVINTAATWLVNQFKQTSQELTQVIISEVSRERLKAERGRKVSVLAAWASSVAAVFAVTSVITLLVMGLR